MIDEKKLIEKIERMRHIVSKYSPDVAYACGNLLCELKDYIDEQPQVGGWIPVTERLPEENEVYLVTWIDERNIPYIELVEYYPDTKSWQGIIQAGRGYEILAWQPLPPAYKER